MRRSCATVPIAAHSSPTIQMTIDAVKRKLCFHCGTPPSAQVSWHAHMLLQS